MRVARNLTTRLGVALGAAVLALGVFALVLAIDGARTQVERESARSFDSAAAVAALVLQQDFATVERTLGEMLLSTTLVDAILGGDRDGATAQLRRLRGLDKRGLFDLLVIAREDAPTWIAAGLALQPAPGMERLGGGALAREWDLLDGGQHIVLVHSLPIADPASGRVVGHLRGGMQLDGNLPLLNRIRTAAGLEAAGLLFNDRLIAAVPPDAAAALEGNGSAGLRVARRPAALPGTHGALQLVMALPAGAQATWTFSGRIALFAVAVAAVLLGLFTLLARQVTVPLNALAREARAITAAPEQGLAVPRGHAEDEIGSLVASFNQLVGSITTSERRFRAAFEQGFLLTGLLARDGTLLEVNRAALEVAGTRAAEVLGKPLADGPWWRDNAPQRQRLLAALEAAADGHSCCFEATHPSAGGGVITVLFSVTPVELGAQRQILAAALDISDRVRAEEALRRQSALLASLLDSLPDLVFFKDTSGVYMGCNPEFCRFVGRTREEVVGQRAAAVFDAATAHAHCSNDDEVLRDGQWRRKEDWFVDADGQRRLIETLKAPMRDPDGRLVGLVGVGRDITERHLAEARIHSLAYYDALTGLPNRRLLGERLTLLCGGDQRVVGHAALLLIDLDYFKLLNDTQGHHVGDRLLVEVAARLRVHAREGDTVARLGGDEFVVLAHGLGDNAQTAAASAERIAEDIRSALGVPYSLGGREYHGSPSIGVCVFGAGEAAAEELLKRAEVAMYAAKAGGRNAVCTFDPQMQASLSTRADVESELRAALRDDQLRVYFQPQVQGGRLIGAEALVRWEHPQRGLVGPAEFIPVAEESGLIVPIGERVLEVACIWAQRWQVLGGAQAPVVAVNVSARQFRAATFVPSVAAALAQSGVDPGRIKLELTETVVLENVDDSIARMQALKALGVGLSMDDFGTGYSSLTYLKRLPVDQIKIDRSFVRDLPDDQNDAVIVRAIIAMAASLGLEVLAEGVETSAQQAFLEAAGCVRMQGYLHGRPMPPEALEALLGSA